MRIATAILCAVVITATLQVVWLGFTVLLHMFGLGYVTPSDDLARLLSSVGSAWLPYVLVLPVVLAGLLYKALSSDQPVATLKAQAWGYAFLVVLGEALWWSRTLRYSVHDYPNLMT